ncbi:MAG: glycosyltransferase family 4 protein [Promethearchaeota archaeon]
MVATLKDRKLLTLSNTFPNFSRNFTAGNFIKNQLDGVNEAFSEVTVISPVLKTFGRSKRDRLCKDYSYSNVQVNYPRVFFWRTIDNRLKVIRRIIKEKNIDFDLIHAHYGTMGHIIEPLVQEYMKPLINSFYGYDAYLYKYDSLYYERLFEHSTLILTLSDHMSERMEGLGCSPHKIKKLHIGIDTDTFKPRESISKKKEGDKLKILIVANFVEKKGILDAIHAFSNVYKKFKNIHLDILGTGPLKTRIEELIHTLDLQSVVQILNNLATKNPRQTVLNYMQNCDIFLLPSVKAANGDSEGTPVVLMEASACGKPCITTQHSGNPEVVIDGENGITVPERDIESLSDGLTQLIEDEEKRNRLGRNGRKHICAEFDSKVQSKRLIEIYEKIL